MQSSLTATQPMRMPRTVAQALMFLERHGHSPIMTPDGILVVCPVRILTTPDNRDDYMTSDLAIDLTKATDGQWRYAEPDVWLDEQEVFPVVGNVVDLAPIRDWQGY